MSAVLHLCTTVQETRYQTNVYLGHKQCLKKLGVLLLKTERTGNGVSERLSQLSKVVLANGTSSFRLLVQGSFYSPYFAFPESKANITREKLLGSSF